MHAPSTISTRYAKERWTRSRIVDTIRNSEKMGGMTFWHMGLHFGKSGARLWLKNIGNELDSWYSINGRKGGTPQVVLCWNARDWKISACCLKQTTMRILYRCHKWFLYDAVNAIRSDNMLLENLRQLKEDMRNKDGQYAASFLNIRK